VAQPPPLHGRALNAGTGSAKTKKVRPDDLVTLYEKMAGVISQISELGKAADDKTLAEVTRASTAQYAAFREFYLGESFLVVSATSRSLCEQRDR
jgi:hypothetical protein